MSGEYVFEYLWVVKFFGWGVTEYSNLSTFQSTLTIVGLGVFMPVFTLCGIADVAIICLTAALYTVSDLIRGFATDPWMFYLGEWAYFWNTRSVQS